MLEGLKELAQRTLGPTWPLDFHVPAGLPPVLADPNQIEMALLNLLVNARDASPEGGKISVEAITRTVAANEIEGLKPASYIRISVVDRRTGMDADTLAKATEPFFTTKGVGKGTGLGLSMIHGLARQLQGTFELQSMLGTGTTATLWLPVSTSQAEQMIGQDIVRHPAVESRLKILAVDDDPIILMNTAVFLEDMGHEVWEAGSATDALELLRADSNVDLLITDQAMPGMTGTQLAMQLAAEHLTIPIILATGYGELPTESGLQVVKLGKPFSPAELELAINRAMAAAR